MLPHTSAGNLWSKAERAVCGGVTMVRGRRSSPGSPALHPDEMQPRMQGLMRGVPIQKRQYHLGTGFVPYRVVPASLASARGHVLRQERCHQI